MSIDPDWPAPAYQPSDDVDTTPPAPGGSWPHRLAGWRSWSWPANGCRGRCVRRYASGPTRCQPGGAGNIRTGAPLPGIRLARVGRTRQRPCARWPSLPRFKTGRPWNGTPEDSNYDPCADLSTVLNGARRRNSSRTRRCVSSGNVRRNRNAEGLPVHQFDQSGNPHKRHGVAELSDTSKTVTAAKMAS